ncbi:MAG: DUF1206 domain-containing protein [Ornithinimicrobium sp.]
MTRSAEQVADDIGDHPALEWVARAGYAVNGLLHVLIAAIVIRILVGQGGEADQAGALQAVAQAPLGGVMLWIGVIGYTGLAIWQILDAVTGWRPGATAVSLADRGKDVGKAGVYAALAWTTWKFASGGSTDSGETTSDFTTSLMSAPAGQILVGAVGLGVVGVGGYHVWKGVTRTFLEDLDDNAPGKLGRLVEGAGVVGYVAKGLALGMVGGLFVWAAWTTDPKDATGLDGAVRSLTDEPFGSVVLAVVAGGFVAYGLYSMARARYAAL